MSLSGAIGAAAVGGGPNDVTGPRRRSNGPCPFHSRLPGTALRTTVLGLALLGLTSVYREGFEIVIFLQGLRERYG